jgi:hypothetical protein
MNRNQPHRFLPAKRKKRASYRLLLKICDHQVLGWLVWNPCLSTSATLWAVLSCKWATLLSLLLDSKMKPLSCLMHEVLSFDQDCTAATCPGAWKQHVAHHDLPGPTAQGLSASSSCNHAA